MRIYVGNLSRDITTEQLTELVAPFGVASSARVVTDRSTGESRGFGFVEMDKNEEAQAAITGLNGREVSGQALVVNEARPMANQRAKA